jgi:hypothetical protein
MLGAFESSIPGSRFEEWRTTPAVTERGAACTHRALSVRCRRPTVLGRAVEAQVGPRQCAADLLSF